MNMQAEASSPLLRDGLLGQEVIEDPYSVFNRLREESAVHWDHEANAWLISSYSGVAEVLRQPKVFASDRATFYSHYLPEQRKDFYQVVFDVYPRWMAGNDPPVHDHMRRIVNSNWTPGKIQDLRAQVRSTIDRLLADLPVESAVDLLEAFAVPLPAIIISSVIGVPKEDWPAVKRWTDDWSRLHFSPEKDTALWDKGAGGLNELYRYVASKFAEYKDAGGENYFTKVLNAQFDGDRLTHDEMIVHIIEQLFAGHETTTNLIGNGMVLLMRQRDQWERLCRDTSLAASAVEEILRYEGPVKMITRWAKEDCKLGGQTIRKGQNLLLILAAANRDPRQFPNPERFDIGRSPNHHLTFGQGIHFCLGAPLARLEAEEAFRALATRFPRIGLATGELRHRPVMRARALESLPVRLDQSVNTTPPREH